MNNLDSVLWKLLGEYVEIDVLPRDWENFSEVEEIKYFCTTVKGFLRLIDDEWVLGDFPIDTKRVYRIIFQRDVSEKSLSCCFNSNKSC